MADRGGRLEFSTIFNVRDLGGYQTAFGRSKPRRFMRSGDTMFLSDEDLQTMREYGVSRVIDLRMSIERPDLSDRFAHLDGIAWENSSMADDRTMTKDWMASGRVVEFVVEGYLRMLSDFEGVQRIVSFMAQAKPDECVLFHCAGGMDRTGVISMIILGAAGAMHADIVHDYASAFGTDEEVDEAMARWSPDNPLVPHDGIDARVQAMHELHGWIISEFGSVRKMLNHCGVPNSDVDALVSHLVD